MYFAAPAGSPAALIAVRRMIADAATSLTPPAPVAAVAALPDDAHAQTGGEPVTARLAGQILPAIVLQRLDDEHGVVDIQGEQVRVSARLPAAGQAVTLRFAAAANPASPAPAAQVTLGPLAQVLSEVAQVRAEPLDLGAVPAPVTMPRQFAAGLSDMVRDSGVFYESHLERWSRGQYPLENIKREPQAAGSPRPVDGPARSATTQTAAGAVPAAAARAVDNSQPVMREQLDLIERRSLDVVIQAWPGQTARLTIADPRDEEGTSHHSAAEPAWSTRLALELPNLGRLEANLSLAGQRLGLTLHTSPGHAIGFRNSAGDLAGALEDAGIRLAGLRIIHDPDE